VARWAAFLGLTGVVLTLFLGLARLSQGAVRNPSASGGTDGTGTDAGPETTESGDTDPGPDSRWPADSPDERPAPHPADVESRGNDTEPRGNGTAPSVQAGGADRLATEDRPRPDSPPWEAASGPGPGGEPPALSTGALLANVALTQGLFGGVLAAGALYFAVPPSALGLGGESLGLLAAGVGLGAVLWVANELAAALADAAGAGYDEGLRKMLAPDSPAGWAALFGLVLPVVALVEEFVFRAAVIGAPAVGFGTPAWALVPVSAGTFALGHGAQGRVGVAVTGGLGLVLAGAYAVTGSLLVVVVAHYLVNALEFLVHELLAWPRLWSS